VDLQVVLRPETADQRAGAVEKAVQDAVAELGISADIALAGPVRGASASKALAALVGSADAEYVLFVDDSTHDLRQRIRNLWGQRDRGDLLISSRCSDDRGTRPKELRREWERYVERWLARVLTLDTNDVRSPIQMLRMSAARDLLARGVDFDDPIDVCVRAAVAGWRIAEVRLPFWPLQQDFPAKPRRPKPRHLYTEWSRRNGIDSADYDMRAFNSRLPPQRAWQRRRHAVTYEAVKPFLNTAVLNVGAGSGRLALDLPGSVCVDVVHAKLRYMRRYEVNRLVTASVFALPFPDRSFDCVVCCEVIEHVPADPSPLAELVRVLRPGGRLVLSTPDYGTPVWPTIEKAYAIAQPKGYADEHVTHYTEASLIAAVQSLGLRCVSIRKVYRAILVATFEVAC
jgi:SAM-dependent methyltransferase